jgi:hypothetical protein
MVWPIIFCAIVVIGALSGIAAVILLIQAAINESIGKGLNL